ncbi:hypothetical protein D3C77_640280 [compost metagenome]
MVTFRFDESFDILLSFCKQNVLVAMSLTLIDKPLDDSWMDDNAPCNTILLDGEQGVFQQVHILACMV